MTMNRKEREVKVIVGIVFAAIMIASIICDSRTDYYGRHEWWVFS